MTSIEEKKKNRLKFLNALYEVTGGNEITGISAFDLGAELGFDRNTTMEVVDFLVREGLLKYFDMGRKMNICITHPGVHQIEDAKSKPNRPTRFFPPINILIAGKVENSQIQQGSPGATQIKDIAINELGEIKSIVALLKEFLNETSLTSTQISDMKSQIETLEAQLRSPSPRRSIIIECLSYIETILLGLSMLSNNPLLNNIRDKISSLVHCQ